MRNWRRQPLVGFNENLFKDFKLKQIHQSYHDAQINHEKRQIEKLLEKSSSLSGQIFKAQISEIHGEDNKKT